MGVVKIHWKESEWEEARTVMVRDSDKKYRIKEGG
jgi:hypothetical protein